MTTKKPAVKIKPFIPRPDQQICAGYLEVAIMPNGELLHQGKTVGWTNKCKDLLYTRE